MVGSVPIYPNSQAAPPWSLGLANPCTPSQTHAAAMPLLPAAAQGCFAHMCWDIFLLHWWNLKVEIISCFSRANCWQMGILSLLPSRGMAAGKDFLSPDSSSVHPHPQVLVWWRVGRFLTLSTVISSVLCPNFQRVVTGELFCHCWGSLALTEYTQVDKHSFKLLVKSPRATFPNHHWLPNNNKKKKKKSCIFLKQNFYRCVCFYFLLSFYGLPICVTVSIRELSCFSLPGGVSCHWVI